MNRQGMKKVKCTLCDNIMHIDKNSKGGLCSDCVSSGRLPEYEVIRNEEKQRRREGK